MDSSNIIKTVILGCLNEQTDRGNKRSFLSGSDLPKIQDFLESLGLSLMPYDLDDETNIVGNPLVRDGLNGIRATYDKWDDELTVWFTNNYEDPNNETRKRVESFLETLT
jgi:hypothetical protein